MISCIINTALQSMFFFYHMPNFNDISTDQGLNYFQSWEYNTERFSLNLLKFYYYSIDLPISIGWFRQWDTFVLVLLYMKRKYSNGIFLIIPVLHFKGNN